MQTAELCDFPSKMAVGVIEELGDIGNAKIDETLERLPDGFPEVTAESISGAAKRRLDQLNSTRNQSARGVP